MCVEELVPETITKPAFEFVKSDFVADFEESTCYHPPLTLTDGKRGTFLETTFAWTGSRFAYWLKNENEVGKEPVIWRYKDFRSHAPFAQNER